MDKVSVACTNKNKRCCCLPFSLPVWVQASNSILFECCLSKHEMTIYAKNIAGVMASWAPLATTMIGNKTGILTDNLLIATYALSYRCIPVSNVVAEWVFSHVTAVFQTGPWRDHGGANPPCKNACPPVKMCGALFKTKEHLSESLGPYQETLLPPGVPRWLRAWFW